MTSKNCFNMNSIGPTAGDFAVVPTVVPTVVPGESWLGPLYLVLLSGSLSREELQQQSQGSERGNQRSPQFVQAMSEET